MKEKFLAPETIEYKENTDLYMTFNLSDKLYAILAKQITEIVQLPALTSLEKLPDFITGLMNIRGKVISVIDCRKFLGIEIKGYTTEHQVLVVEHGNHHFGVIVDSVNDVLPLNKDFLEPLPYSSSNSHITGLYKKEGTLIACLNINSLMEEVKQIKLEDYASIETEDKTFELFPSDELSLEKLNKRALNLKKELKIDINNNYYQEKRFVAFSLNKEIYCINLKYVKEFCKIKLVNLTPVPCVPSFIEGLINLRGEFITIIDLKNFLQIPKTNVDEKTKIIVVKTEHIQIGLIVDDVFDIVNIPDEKIHVIESSKFENNKYISAEVMLNEFGIVSILNLEQFLADDALIHEDAI